MQTDELVEALSRNPVPRHRVPPALVIGLAALSAGAMAVVLSFAWLYATGVPPEADVHDLLIKFAFIFGVILSALVLVRDLAVPGRRLRLSPAVVVVPFALMLAFAGHELMSLDGGTWRSHAAHTSWLGCLWQVGLFAIPAFAILAFAVRRLAPVRLRHAGFQIGLVAGGIGAMCYALHARDESLAFSLVAHGIAILLIAAIGALAGPRLLKWS